MSPDRPLPNRASPTASPPAFATRLGRVTPSATQAVMVEAERLRRQGVDVVDLGPGEPDFATPPHIKEAGAAAIAGDFTRYTPSAGVAELREAICARYAADYGVDYRPEEAIITAGGKQALFNVALALCGPGDEVITHAPGWPSIPEQVRLAEAEPVVVRTRPEDGFRLHPQSVIEALTPRTRAVVVNAPSNPTGALVTEADLAAIAEAAAPHGVWIVVDLCYERLVYDGPAPNLPRALAARNRDRSVLVGSFSKSYAMTGWRCGWALGPAPLIAAANAIQGHSTSNVSSITQQAALAALRGPQACVAAMRDEYRTRRDRMMEWLAPEPRIRVAPPAGAFYLFPDIGELLAPEGPRTSAEFAARLLREAHVAVTPGEAFDAPGFLRLSYAASLERLQTAADRLLRFAAALG